MKYLPTYNDCLKMVNKEGSPFIEKKTSIDGYDISLFNYRLAQWTDFNNPLGDNSVKGYEMRGLTFVFNKDGSVFKRFLLLEKFFNLNQTTDSMYSVVKDLDIKNINNKEDGSVASFIQLPNGKIVGKSKMGFDNEQAEGINRVYKNNKYIREFVNWTIDNDIVAIFEYVSPRNRIVLNYKEEDLILLKMRDNKTGEHLDITKYGELTENINIAEFKNEKTLDELIQLSKVETGIEGWVIEFYNGLLIKIKTKWYSDRHGLLTNDLYRENIIIDHIINDNIDDILGQVPEDEKEARDRINKIISIVKNELNYIEKGITEEYNFFKKSGMSKKDYAVIFKPVEYFGPVMSILKREDLEKLSESEILSYYDSFSDYENVLSRLDVFEISKSILSKKTKKLIIARNWLKSKDQTLFFRD